MLGVLYSDGFSNFFSSDGGEKNVEKKFLPCLASIIFMLINKGRKINSLAKDLISLMNTEKTLDEIIQTVNNGTIDFKKLRKQSTFFKSEDNVSLIVFCLEKNSSKLVSDSDVDSDNELDGYQEVLQDKEPILNVSDRVGTIIVEVEKVAEIKNYSVEKNQHGSIEKGNEQLFRNNQNIAVEDNFVQKEKNDPEIKSLENEPENRLKRFLKKLYPIRFSKGKVFLLSSFCLGLLAIVYYLKPQLFSRA